MIKVGVTVVAGGKGRMFNIDVKLGITGWTTLGRVQSTHLMIQSTVYPERVRTTTGEDSVIHIDSQRCEGKGRVVLTNALSKLSGARCGAGKQPMQQIRWIGKWRQLDLTLKTAYTKLWMNVGRVGEPFQLEVHSMTVRALNRHGTQRMPTGRFLVWLTSWRNSHQSLIVVNGLLDHLLMLYHFLFIFNLCLLHLLLLHFSHMSLMLINFLIMINPPLLLLLLLHFSHTCLMLQSVSIMINLSLTLHFSHTCLMLQDFS